MKYTYSGLETSAIELPLQHNVDLVARFTREKRIADLLRDSSAAVRVAGRDRQSRHQEVGWIVVAWANVALTRRIVEK